jgi:hypothetical protein
VAERNNNGHSYRKVPMFGKILSLVLQLVPLVIEAVKGRKKSK